jgi:phosphohistidine phosphatase
MQSLQLLSPLTTIETMDVYLVRHAHAEERDKATWPNDNKRPLAKEGKRRFASLLKRMNDLPDYVDILATSPLTRAKETADLLVEKAAWQPYVVWDELSVDMDPALVVEKLRNLRGVSSVALVGHEPQMSMLFSLLISGTKSGVHMEFKKGAIARIGFSPRKAGPGKLHWLVAP